MNAAAMGNAYPLPHVRPTDRPTAGVHGKAPKLCPGTVGRSFPKALSLPPSSSQGEAKGKGGTSLFPWLFKGILYKDVQASAARQAVGRLERGELAHRAAAVHALVVWAGQLSTGGTGTPLAQALVGSGEGWRWIA